MEGTKLILAILTLMYFVFTNKEVSAYDCTNYNIKKCLKPSTDYIKRKNIENPQHEELQLFHLKEQEIRQYCQIYETKTNPCLKRIIGHCTDLDKKSFQGVEDATDYLCKEALEVYIKHKSCIGSANVQDKVKACIVKAEREINGLGVIPSSEQLCRIVDDAVKCDEESVSSCGSEAQEMMKEYGTRLLDPIYNCQKDNNSSIIAPVIAVGVFMLVLVIIIARLYCRNKKMSTQQSQNPVALSNVHAGGLGAVPYQPYNNSIAGAPPDYRCVNPTGAVPMPPPSYRTHDGMSTYEGNTMNGSLANPQYTTLQTTNPAAVTSINSNEPSAPASSLGESNPTYIDPEQKHNTVAGGESTLSQGSSPDYSYVYATPR